MLMQSSSDELSAGNFVISKFLTNNQPFSVGRLGSVESNIIQAMKFGQMPSRLRWQAWVNAGISYPSNRQLRVFDFMYRESISSLDVLAVWPDVTLDSQSNLVQSGLKKNAITIPLRCLDPVQLTSQGITSEEIWTNKLEGRNVLVLHSFAKLIESQYLKRDELHRFKILPKFNLFVLEPPETNGLIFWRGSYGKNLNEFLVNLINYVESNKIEVVLLASGAYGLPIVKHLRDSNVSAIYMGGSLQLLFGIMGSRWRELSNIESLMTNAWIDGSKGKKPFGYKLIEGATYW